MQRIPTLTLALLIAAAPLTGCGDGGHHDTRTDPAGPDGHAEHEGSAPVEDRYTVRGEITALDNHPDGSRVFLHHEAIPEFRSGGEVVGMDSMTMGFALAPDVPADGLAVGDKVEFEWVLGPDDPAGSIVRVDRLDPATELDFGDGGMSDSPDNGGAHEGHGS